MAGPAVADSSSICGVDLVTGDTACRGTDAELAAWAQADMAGAAVPTGAAARSSRPAVAPAAAAASTLIGKIWQDKNKAGSSYSFFTSGPCNGDHSDVDWELGDLSSIGWNDRVSSFQGYSSCYIKLYQNANYSGSTYGPYASSDYVGDAINDAASSIRFY